MKVDPDDYPALEALWRRAQGEHVHVRWYGLDDAGRAGYFAPAEGDRREAQIWIVRPYYVKSTDPSRDRSDRPASAAEITAELLTFAHEYGHCRSWQRGIENGEARAEWLRYRAAADHFDAIMTRVHDEYPDGPVRDLYRAWRHANQTELTVEERDYIVAEESLAWQIGREVLAELGHADFARYDEHTRRHVHNYRYRLGMDGLWPEDIAEGAVE